MRTLISIGSIAAGSIIALSGARAPEIQERVIVQEQVRVEYRTAPRDPKFWETLIDHFSEEFAEKKDVKLFKRVMRTIFLMESSRGVNTYAYNDHKMPQSRKITDHKLDQKMLASAICPFQVLGLTAHEYGVTWEEIAYQPTECVRFAAFYVRKLFDRFAEHTGEEKVRLVFRGYYGKDVNGEIYSKNGIDLLEGRLSARSLRKMQPRKKRKGVKV